MQLLAPEGCPDLSAPLVNRLVSRLSGWYRQHIGSRHLADHPQRLVRGAARRCGIDAVLQKVICI
jgi:hypothetical protein